MSEELSGGRWRPAGWQLVAGLAAAVLLALGVGLLIARAAGFSEVRDAIERADAKWFGICLVAEVAALVAYAEVIRGALRWRRTTDPGLRLATYVMLAGIGAARVFAPGGAGALAATYWCFRRAGFVATAAVVAVLGSSVLFYVSFGAGAWLAALVLAAEGETSRWLVLPWLVAVPLCGAAALVVTRGARREELESEGASLVRRGIGIAVATLRWVRDALGDAAARRMLVASVLFWIGNLVCLWAALRSVGIALSLAELVLAYATGHVAAIAPLPFGGVGGVDAALTYALTVVGVSLAPALVGVAVYRLFSFWLPTIPGIVALVLLPRARHRLEAASGLPT